MKALLYGSEFRKGKRKEKQYKLISNDWIDFLNSLYKTQKLKQAVGLLPPLAKRYKD